MHDINLMIYHFTLVCCEKWDFISSLEDYLTYWPWFLTSMESLNFSRSVSQHIPNADKICRCTFSAWQNDRVTFWHCVLYIFNNQSLSNNHALAFFALNIFYEYRIAAFDTSYCLHCFNFIFLNVNNLYTF